MTLSPLIFVKNLKKGPPLDSEKNKGRIGVAVVIAFGKSYIKPAFACINSLLQNTALPHSRLHLYLIIEEVMLFRVEKLLRNEYDNSIVYIRRSFENFMAYNNTLRVNKGPNFYLIPYNLVSVPKHKVWVGPQNLDSSMNFIRFQLVSLLPEVHKVIYLDPDTIVQGDIAFLYDEYLRKNGFSLFF
jgi:lipopolysaccharide biosynthesis glycosyltransferase